MRSGLIALVLVLGGCEFSSQSNGKVAKADKPAVDTHQDSKPVFTSKQIVGEWSLVAIDQQPLSGGGTPTLIFENDGKCYGSTGVNRYTSWADFEKIGDGQLKIGYAAVTRMAGPPEAMALENLFLDRLNSASSFRMEGDQLHLVASKKETITFERVAR